MDVVFSVCIMTRGFVCARYNFLHFLRWLVVGVGRGCRQEHRNNH